MNIFVFDWTCLMYLNNWPTRISLLCIFHLLRCRYYQCSPYLNSVAPRTISNTPFKLLSSKNSLTSPILPRFPRAPRVEIISVTSRISSNARAGISAHETVLTSLINASGAVGLGASIQRRPGFPARTNPVIEYLGASRTISSRLDRVEREGR
ncbi:hypothetical protein AG1IA_08659 [Rhizoctonia solani AG-1 IA]|uniref:Uncharacterized protein n=1 Tax=Thanatephorus cucumeris (strain AG1-IA) TaxID=983506 RepID=L8WLW6_THACA|nr:hypothetical protein AG1IA_08659 [Rhizoctonia solani AG-1 IA]